MVTVKNALNLLKDVITFNINSDRPTSICLEGSHGIGKTEGVISIIEELKKEGVELQHVLINLAEIASDDFCGYPIPQLEIVKDNDKKWITEKSINFFLDKGYIGTGNSRTFNAPPEWVSQLNPNVPVVLYLDDYSRVLLTKC